MATTKSWAEGIPTIDVAMVVLRTGTVEIALDTSNSVAVEPQIEEADPVQLIIKGKLIAQKPATSTITGHQITLTDNVFTPEIAKILQGGTILGEGLTLTYQPPVSGSDEKGEVFELDCYSAEYDSSGQIVKYEKITYPNCQGTPFAINTEDDTFRVTEYTINSAPKKGEAPYKISYVEELPISDFTTEETLQLNTMSVTPQNAQIETNTTKAIEQK